MAYKHGSFVWFELLTGEVDKAKAFYPEVFGYGTSDQDMGDFVYTMLTQKEQPQAGVLKPPMDGVPNHWTSYLSVDDVDAKAKAVEENGGKIVVPPTDIPNIGRFALVADPQGGHFNLFKGSESDDNATTAFHWNELWTKDAKAAVAWYEKVFGFSHTEMDMGMGTYYVLKSGPDQSVGGIMTSPEEKIPTMWLPYLSVDDADATVDRIKNNGGSVKMGPTDVETVGRFAVIADNAGAVLGVIKPAA
jgi:hypothetical protein